MEGTRRGLRCAARALFVGLAACATAGPDLRSESAPGSAQGPRGDLRLSRDVVPTAYRLDLTIDPRSRPGAGSETGPDAGTVTGEAVVSIELARPSDVVQLHAEGLELGRIVARAGGETLEVEEVVQGPSGSLVLRFPDPLPAGPSELEMTWRGAIGRAPEGLYRVEVDGRWYAFTQFEPLDARTAFPCFDQPDFKATFDVTLRVPAGMIALSNSPEIARADAGEGWTRFTFSRTRPLPTYLVAFAVGAFDVVPAPEGAIPGVPFRVATVHGKGGLAAFALETTPPLLAVLAEWFGRPYPYPKLDLLAVPNFSSGAMENAGLITFREPRILLDPARATERDRFHSRLTNAHELAHHWFGNLVTMAWWDDLWLNEAFATWMETKVLAREAPETEPALEALGDTLAVMRLDAKSNARAIRNPIADGGDIENAFDGITYTKGAAVLSMLESWLGEAAFRKGVRDYLDRHAHGNATTADLLAALSRASGKPVEETVGTFLDEPGVPLVHAEVRCDDDPLRPAVLSLRQSRYRVLGGEPVSGGPWRIPVCVRYSIGDRPYRECLVLDRAEWETPLGAPGCPDWLHPDAGERGYYRWSLPPAELAALAGRWRKALSIEERVALPSHLAAQVEAGRLDAGSLLDALSELSLDPHPRVVEGVADALALLHRPAVQEAPEDVRRSFEAFVRRRLAPHLARIGLEPKAGEASADRLLRPALVRALANLGGDESILRWARDTASRLLADLDRAAEEAETADLALPLAAWTGDEALWQALRDALPKAPTPQLRVALVEALGSFSDPALLLRSLDLALDGTLLSQEFRHVVRGARRLPATMSAAWRWLGGAYERLGGVLGESSAPHLPHLAQGLCTEAARAEVLAFFSDPARSPPGTARNLGLVREEIDLCVTLRRDLSADLASWLALHGAR